jgi:hypothetical protein
VAFVRTEVSEEIISIIIFTRIGEVGTTLAVTSNTRCSVLRLLATANVVPSSPILVTLMMEAICSSETSVLRRAKQCNIPEEGILHGHRREETSTLLTLPNLYLQNLLLPLKCV